MWRVTGADTLQAGLSALVGSWGWGRLAPERWRDTTGVWWEMGPGRLRAPLGTGVRDWSEPGARDPLQACGTLRLMDPHLRPVDPCPS